jgi:hypothetical protein
VHQRTKKKLAGGWGKAKVKTYKMMDNPNNKKMNQKKGTQKQTT